jgi:hypothetical protein
MEMNFLVSLTLFFIYDSTHPGILGYIITVLKRIAQLIKCLVYLCLMVNKVRKKQYCINLQQTVTLYLYKNKESKMIRVGEKKFLLVAQQDFRMYNLIYTLQIIQMTTYFYIIKMEEDVIESLQIFTSKYR